MDKIKNKFSVKIKTSIVAVVGFIVALVVCILIYFQYHSSNQFALLTTQKEFDKVTANVINQIKEYDTQSINFINLIQTIDNINELPTLNKKHILLPMITNYIDRANYIYGIYVGFSNNYFYIVYNLNLSSQMRRAQKAPKKARWLVKKNIKTDGKFISYKTFLDKNFNIIQKKQELTSYKPTLRP